MTELYSALKSFNSKYLGWTEFMYVSSYWTCSHMHHKSFLENIAKIISQICVYSLPVRTIPSLYHCACSTCSFYDSTGLLVLHSGFCI